MSNDDEMVLKKRKVICLTSTPPPHYNYINRHPSVLKSLVFSLELLEVLLLVRPHFARESRGRFNSILASTYQLQHQTRSIREWISRRLISNSITLIIPIVLTLIWLTRYYKNTYCKRYYPLFSMVNLLIFLRTALSIMPGIQIQ